MRLSFVFFALLQSFSASLTAKPTADIVYINAKVHTVDDNLPRADSFAIKDGKFLQVGDSSRIIKTKDEKTQVIDLQGKTVLPGFIDNHNHIFEGASEAGGNCQLAAETSLLDLIPDLEYCLEQAQLSDWVIGYGHTFAELDLAHLKVSPRQLLDEIFAEIPVVLMEQTSHSMLVNSAALSLAGFDDSSKDPVGGVLMRDDDGSLNGVLFDNAGDMVMEIAWNDLKNKFSVNYQSLLNGLFEVASKGITTVGDGRMYWRRGWYPVWLQALADGNLTARVSVRPWIYPEIALAKQLSSLKRMLRNDLNDLLIVNQVKLYSDGIVHFGTAKLLSPYNFTYFEQYPYGINYLTKSDMQLLFEALNKIGYGAHVHAIGDGAVRETLDVIESMRNKGSKQIFNMTHLEFIEPTDLLRFAKLNVFADLQVGAEHVLHQEHSWLVPFVGKKRARDSVPLAALFKADAKISLSSDWTVNPLSPFVAMSNAMAMKNKGRFSFNQALKASTLIPAQALGLAHITGSISAGKSADFIIIDKDPTKLSPSNIKNIKVESTFLQGEKVFSRNID